MWFSKYFMGNLKMDKAGEGDAGGGGDAGKGDQGKGDAGKPDGAQELATLKSQNAALEARLAKLEGKGDAPPDPDLLEKSRRERELADKNSSNTKALEAALKFNLGSKDWLKTNASLLPKDIEDIFTTAEKETYADAMEKDAAIKSGIIQSFFSLQSNMDLLTPGLKSKLDDYLKLTKTGKAERAQSIYDDVFEPAFEMLKRVKKSEALNGGYGSATDADRAYKEKLMKGSRNHFLGEKQ